MNPVRSPAQKKFDNQIFSVWMNGYSSNKSLFKVAVSYHKTDF